MNCYWFVRGAVTCPKTRSYMIACKVSRGVVGTARSQNSFIKLLSPCIRRAKRLSCLPARNEKAGSFLAMKSEYYREKRRQGEGYEQYIKEQWPKIYPLRTLTFFNGAKAQLLGETKEGVEIKNDNLIEQYGRLYIETAEKSHESNECYVPSGIYREDNTQIYLVGDYTQCWLFSKRYLRWLDQLDPPFLYRPPVDKATSKGFCIPVRNADQLCLDHIWF